MISGTHRWVQRRLAVDRPSSQPPRRRVYHAVEFAVLARESTPLVESLHPATNLNTPRKLLGFYHAGRHLAVESTRTVEAISSPTPSFLPRNMSAATRPFTSSNPHSSSSAWPQQRSPTALKGFVKLSNSYSQQLSSRLVAGFTVRLSLLFSQEGQLYR